MDDISYVLWFLLIHTHNILCPKLISVYEVERFQNRHLVAMISYGKNREALSNIFTLLLFKPGTVSSIIHVVLFSFRRVEIQLVMH